jgi:hypothetical protein
MRKVMDVKKTIQKMDREAPFELFMMGLALKEVIREGRPHDLMAWQGKTLEEQGLGGYPDDHSMDDCLVDEVDYIFMTDEETLAFIEQTMREAIARG